ncbi:MAG: tetratricopeptide repeat protein, partial [bacterium]
MPLRVVEGSGNSGSHHFRELIQEARWCFLANNVERARELFERASQIEPHHPEVLHGLGVVALKEGRYKEAVSLLQQAVGKDPRFAEAWNNLGFALFKKGRHSEAKKALEKAVELEPEERSYRENLQALSRGNPPKAKPKNQPPFLSLCMIVRDEAANLRMYLAQIVDLFEDIVVIDTGSRDNTREIAASLGARVFPFSWNNDFSAARNESLRRARGEWILVLDADEVVEREGIQGLREITRNTQATGFQLPIYNYNGAGKVGVINFALRFFRRHPGIRFAGKIHETVETSIVDLGGIIGRANIPIHHFGYTDSDALRRKSLERNLPIIEEILRSEPDNIQA